jgi:hypothetical protein
VSGRPLGLRRAAKPENSIRDLLRPTKATDGDIFQHRAERFSLTSGHHLIDHWRMDDARTYGIDANTFRGVFQRRASGVAVVYGLARP